MQESGRRMKKRVFTHEEKCTGCNKCISVCPVDCANQVYRAFDGTRKVMVDSEYCISCGACITVCDHQARDYLDDTDRFFQDLALAPNLRLWELQAVRSGAQARNECSRELHRL